MSSEHASVLWIWGPLEVGKKTTVGWEMWSEQTAAGVTAGYLDIDQLGMSLPAPADEPERYRLKSDNLAAVVPNYRAAWAQLLVVSGTCDIAHTRKFADAAAVTLCRLQLIHDEVRVRFADAPPTDRRLAALVRTGDRHDGRRHTTMRSTTRHRPTPPLAHRYWRHRAHRRRR